MRKAYVIGHDMAHPHYAYDAKSIDHLFRLCASNEIRTLFPLNPAFLILSQSILTNSFS